MSNCCHGSANHKGKQIRLGWWLLGGLVVIVAVLWVFSGNVLVDQLASLALGVVALIWLVTWTVRRMGVNR